MSEDQVAVPLGEKLTEPLPAFISLTTNTVTGNLSFYFWICLHFIVINVVYTMKQLTFPAFLLNI